MASDAIVRSFGDVSVKDDVLGLIEILTAQENQFLNGLGKSQAIAGTHAVLTDTLRTAQSRAVAEAADATVLQSSTPSRVANVVETIAIPFAVSGFQSAIDHYQGTKEDVRQTKKAMIDWGNAAEFDIVRGTLTSGASGTAATMKGIISGISTNSTTQTSGTILAMSIILGILQDVYDKGNGQMITDMFMGGVMKRRVSTFTTSNTKFVQASTKEAIEAIDVLDTDFGRIRLHLHRYVQQSSDANARILGVNMDKWKLAYVRAPFVQELAKSGDYTKAQIIGDMTLENRDEPINFFMDGFLKAA